MSEVTIDPAVIKKTQDALGKYVKKPVLSEKLLKKPPFRFLFDVFNTVIRDTGCFDGLYTVEELNIDNINDRDAKMQFLQKMIDVIKIASNEPLSVKTSKIVAGHEPDKTNELLQLMGEIITKKLDWKSAVETVQNGGSQTNSKLKPKEKEKEVKNRKTIDKVSPKVNGIKKTEISKDKSKTELKEKTKSKDAKEKSSKKPPKTDVEKKEEKKTKDKPSTKESLKKTSPDKTKKTLKDSPNLKSESKSEHKSKPDEVKKSKEKPILLDETVEIEDDQLPQNEIKANNINKFESAVNEEENRRSPSAVHKNDERRASKRAEEILLSAAAEDLNLSESRRSSGSKRSSAKSQSRRSSAEKSRSLKTDDVNGKMSVEPPESLKPVAEEAPSQIALNSQTTPDSVQNPEVKRETTFVRENSQEAPTNISRPRTSLRPPSARPASARPGAPRRRDKNVEIILQPNDQVKLSGISVKLETFTSELDDDGENLVIIENPNTEDHLQDIIETKPKEDESLQQGHLVQQILETQKELVQGSAPDTEQKQDRDYDVSKLSSRQSSARQMNSLRDVIQSLTKSVNPLGKLMDFIPEDIDAMQLELTMWRDTYNQSSVELRKERSLTESVTEPMKNQLVSIESTIKEYREMINECRAKILQNAEKIHRLLTTQ